MNLSREVELNISNPYVWGPFFWTSLHVAASQYSLTPTEEERKGFTSFFESLVYVLPCKKCRNDYSEILKYSPVYPHTLSRTDLSVWVWRLHNTVNQKLGRPLFFFSFVHQKYRVDSGSHNINEMVLVSPKPETIIINIKKLQGQPPKMCKNYTF